MTKRIVLRNPLPKDLWCPFCGVQIKKDNKDTYKHVIIDKKERISVVCPSTNFSGILISLEEP